MEQDKKVYDEMLAMVEMRNREWQLEVLRNDLIMLNRLHPRGCITGEHPQHILFDGTTETYYHPPGR